MYKTKSKVPSWEEWTGTDSNTTLLSVYACPSL